MAGVISHAPPGYDCPFCRIASGRFDGPVASSAADLVYAGPRVTAIVASHQWPRSIGNVLVLPNRHVENLYALPDALGAEVQRLVRRVAVALKQVYGCDGVSTRQHNEPAGNQDVWHYHVHVTPRYQGDDLYRGLTTDRFLMPAAERARHAEALRAALAGG